MEDSVEEFTYNMWKKKLEDLEKEVNDDNPTHRMMSHLAYGIRLNHELIKEVKKMNKGITRKDVKLLIMFASSVLVPILTLLIKIWWM